MDLAKPTCTPMVPKTRLDSLNDGPTEDELTQMKNKPYLQVVGSLFESTGQRLCKSRKAAWDVAKYLLRYLRQTRGLELELRPHEDGPRVATDADWANNVQDRKSVSDFVVFLFGCSIHWRSTEQTAVALSSTTAEFIAAKIGLQQVEWIQLVVSDLLAHPAVPLKVTLQIDNQPTIHRIKPASTSGAQKVVVIRIHALKDVWKTGFIALEYVPTHENPADLMTKALNRHELLHRRGLCSLDSKLGDDLGAAACGRGVGNDTRIGTCTSSTPCYEFRTRMRRQNRLEDEMDN